MLSIGRTLARSTIFGATAALMTGFSIADAQAAPAVQATSVPQAETSEIAPMPAATPHWVYVLGGFGMSGVRAFDGSTGKMKGEIDAAARSNFSLDPKGKYYYAAETFWTKVDRGTRIDQVTIWDGSTLKVVGEIPIPGRLIGGTVLSNFTVSSDGKFGYVYTLQPSSSVQVVDLEKHKLVQTVQLPGCAAVFPSGAADASALCANGSLATISIAGGKGSVAHTAPFFPANDDPVFDVVQMDRAKNTAVFVSYTGKVYTAALGASPTFGQPWSLEVAAGMREAENKPLEVSWIPGGRQPFALNRVTGRLYVLMHMGEQWSQKAPGEEVWVVDLATHKILSRHPLKDKAETIQVSQETKPLIYMTVDGNKFLVVDEDTFETKQTVEHASGSLMVVDPS